METEGKRRWWCQSLTSESLNREWLTDSILQIIVCEEIVLRGMNTYSQSSKPPFWASSGILPSISCFVATVHSSRMFGMLSWMVRYSSSSESTPSLTCISFISADRLKSNTCCRKKANWVISSPRSSEGANWMSSGIVDLRMSVCDKQPLWITKHYLENTANFQDGLGWIHES